MITANYENKMLIRLEELLEGLSKPEDKEFIEALLLDGTEPFKQDKKDVKVLPEPE